MSFNPFDIEYEKLNREISTKKLKIREIQEKIKWYDTFDIASLQKTYTKTAGDIRICSEYVSEVESRILEYEKNWGSVNGKLKSRLNPLNIFSSEQRDLRKKKNILSFEIEKSNEEQRACIIKYESLIDEQKQIKLIIREYRDFDRLISLEMSNELLKELAELELRFKVISDRKASVDLQLKPIMDQIYYYRNEIERAEIKVRKAEGFEYELNNASNSYQRAMIHNECEDELGVSSPQKVINKGRRDIDRNNRDLKKAEDRASIIGFKASRDIKKIIIDGNNMCYAGNVFVGLEPLKCIINELILKKYEIVLVFDASINETLKITDDYLETIFKSIEFHIVQHGIQADEIITSIGNNNKKCYILSNDRFGDYRDKEIVRTNRIVNYEIIDNRVLVTDLGIDVAY